MDGTSTPPSHRPTGDPPSPSFRRCQTPPGCSLPPTARRFHVPSWAALSTLERVSFDSCPSSAGFVHTMPGCWSTSTWLQPRACCTHSSLITHLGIWIQPSSSIHPTPPRAPPWMMNPSVHAYLTTYLTYLLPLAPTQVPRCRGRAGCFPQTFSTPSRATRSFWPHSPSSHAPFSLCCACILQSFRLPAGHHIRTITSR